VLAPPFENGVDVVTLKNSGTHIFGHHENLDMAGPYSYWVCMREWVSGRVANPKNTLRIRNPTPEPNAFALVYAIYTAYILYGIIS